MDTLQQFHIVKPLLGQAIIPTSHPVFDSWYRLFRDAGESGDDFFNQTKVRDAALECYTWNGSQRGFQRPRNLLSVPGEDSGAATVLHTHAAKQPHRCEAD